MTKSNEARIRSFLDNRLSNSDLTIHHDIKEVVREC